MRSTVVWYALGSGALVAAAAAGAFAIEHNLGLPIARIEPPATAAIAPAPAVAPNPKKSEVAPAATPAPGFDVVRVEPGGETVVAGHAAPRAKVELRDDEHALASVAADDAGQFVILPEPLTVGSHRLRLAARVGDGEAQLSDVVQVDVAPPKASSPAPVAIAKPPEAKPGQGATMAAAVQPASAAAPPAPRPAPSPTSAPSPEPSVTLAALAPNADAKSAAPVAVGGGRLVVSSVKAGDGGRLEAEGSAEPGMRLRLTLNGAFLADVVAGLNGFWSLTIEHGMTPGLYTLEAQQFAAAGGAHAEASFAYSQALGAATEPASAPAASAKPVETSQSAAAASMLLQDVKPASSHAVVAAVLTTTVVRGDNLWDLARRYYGDGLRYADIYSANSAQIRNPNLIYIGQVFVVPHDGPRP